MRMGDWKGIRLNVKNKPNVPVELYNLATDPLEAKNVAADHPEIVARIIEIMKTARTPSEVFDFSKK